MASFVPEPMEKWAVCAASPISTRLPCRQVSLRSDTKLSHLELLAKTRWPSRTPANSCSISSTDLVSLSPGGRSVAAMSPKARAHTSSCISTMNVLPVRSYG